MTAKEWRDSRPGEKDNIRDYANVSQSSRLLTDDIGIKRLEAGNQ